MLSLYKLAKHDFKNSRRPVTWGPKGQAGGGCSGSTCYRHPSVDWSVHRALPALHDSAKPGSRRQRLMSKTGHRLIAGGDPNKIGRKDRKAIEAAPAAYKGQLKKGLINQKRADKKASLNDIRKHGGVAQHLRSTSPRWGEGNAPGLHGRKTVGMPHPQNMQVSGKTKVAVGGAAVAYGGYKAYQHRDQIRQKAAQVHNGVHNAFHSTHQGIGHI